VAIGPFIVDFFCREANLIIELDGEPHEDEPQVEHDEARTEWLEDRGFRVLRFKNAQVEQSIENVIDTIVKNLPLPRSAGDHGPAEGPRSEAEGQPSGGRGRGEGLC
jgi:very-short-patch-repair endonuclease